MLCRTTRMSCADEYYAVPVPVTGLPNFPPGTRFKPRDDELIESYLNKKIADPNFNFYLITEENISEFHPKDLISKYREKGEENWYFFTKRERKYKRGTRPSRAAAEGYWKATGTEKKIYKKNLLIGFKNSLVYYEGKAPQGIKTNWIMHEFLNKEHQIGVNHQNPCMELDKCVLVEIHYNHKRSGKNKKPEEEEQEEEEEEERMELDNQVKVEAEPTNSPGKGSGFQNPDHIPASDENADIYSEVLDWGFEDTVDNFKGVFVGESIDDVLNGVLGDTSGGGNGDWMGSEEDCDLSDFMFSDQGSS